MKISVVVPTFRRTDCLKRCIFALSQQVRLADEVIVMVRRDDTETLAAVVELAAAQKITNYVLVDRPGVVFALNTALATVTGDIVAITDDDAEPYSDWIKRIGQFF